MRGLPLTFGEEVRVYNILGMQNVGQSTFYRMSKSTCQSFQVLTILPTKASISLPHPIPPGGIFASSSKENDSIVRFH